MAKKKAKLPSTEQLLLSGGDARIVADPLSGRNIYGCQPFPDPQLLAFGSCTASVISEDGFTAASRLRHKVHLALQLESDAAVYAVEAERIRWEWLNLCGLSDITGLALVFAPSGTDVHAIAAQYSSNEAKAPALIIMVDANETGSGVASALAGNVSNLENQGDHDNAAEIVQAALRLSDGTPRPLHEIDAEVEILVSNAVASDRRILIILVDQSKTGLIAPSPACVMALYRRFPDNIDVLVDACQFRLALPTLRAYLKQGFMVALTGSKFLAAPSFSAVLLVPQPLAEHLQQRAFPPGLLPYTAKANWPDNWRGTEHFDQNANFGLLLRFEAALEELRRFRATPQAAVIGFLQIFAEAIRQRLISDPHFEPLPVPQMDRSPLTEGNNWDSMQTIFPFLLYDPQSTGRLPLSREQTLQVYKKLPETLAAMQFPIRCQLGQPVACGVRNGIAVSALRLCISSRMLIRATAGNDAGIATISDAMKVLDKTVLLIRSGRMKKPQNALENVL